MWSYPLFLFFSGCKLTISGDDATSKYLLFLINLFFLDPCENMREILQNVAKQQGVSNMRKLGHLNNFVKVCHCHLQATGVAIERGMLGCNVLTSNSPIIRKLYQSLITLS